VFRASSTSHIAMLSSIGEGSTTAPDRPRVDVVEYKAALAPITIPLENVFFTEVFVCPFISSQGALLRFDEAAGLVDIGG
jgi:hypothetical protein